MKTDADCRSERITQFLREESTGFSFSSRTLERKLMMNQYFSRLAVPLIAMVASSGCSDMLGANLESIDLKPRTLETARVSLQQLHELYETEPEAAMDGLQQLRWRLDQLNGLVARIELAPEHVVDFYDAQADGILIAERAPAGTQRFLRNDDIIEGSAVELYSRLTGGGVPPAALVDADAGYDIRAGGDRMTSGFNSSGPGEFDSSPQPGAGLSSTTQSLTGTDGIWWRDNRCYHGGDFFACLPNRTGHAWASANTKTSFSELAPYRGIVDYHRSFNGTLREIWTLFPGEHWWFYQETGGFSIVNHRWDVVNADGDGFHWAYSFRWNCNGVDCTIRP